MQSLNEWNLPVQVEDSFLSLFAVGETLLDAEEKKWMLEVVAPSHNLSERPFCVLRGQLGWGLTLLTAEQPRARHHTDMSNPAHHSLLEPLATFCRPLNYVLTPENPQWCERQ